MQQPNLSKYIPRTNSISILPMRLYDCANMLQWLVKNKQKPKLKIKSIQLSFVTPFCHDIYYIIFILVFYKKCFKLAGLAL